MVRTEVRGQWVEKGVGVKEDLIMTIQGSSRELQLERDMRSKEFLNWWLKKEKKKTIMETYADMTGQSDKALQLALEKGR